MSEEPEESAIYQDSADAVVDLGNRLADESPDNDMRDIADGLLSGAIHYWLYAYQPPAAAEQEEGWDELDTANQRMQLMLDLIRQSAETSEYLHSPNDRDAGRA